MGNLAAKNKTQQTAEVINDICTNVIQQTISNCSAMVDATQYMKWSSGGNINISGSTFKQIATVSVDCVMKSEKQAEIANNVAVTVAQFMAQNGGVFSIFGASNEAEARIAIANRIKTNINMSTMQNNISSAVSKQLFDLTAEKDINVTNSSFEQTTAAAASSILQESAYAGVINEVASAVAQKSEQKTGFDYSMFYYVALFIFLICFILLGAPVAIYNAIRELIWPGRAI